MLRIDSTREVVTLGNLPERHLTLQDRHNHEICPTTKNIINCYFLKTSENKKKIENFYKNKGRLKKSTALTSSNKSYML